MPDKISIFIAGDSTAAEKTADRRPETGWGEKLSAFSQTKLLLIIEPSMAEAQNLL